MSLNNLKLVDPRSFTQEDFDVSGPIFVESADMRGFFGFGIRLRTKSNFNHSMMMRQPGLICSQNLFYKEVPIEQYMKPGMILKFWVCQDITAVEKRYIQHKIKRDLAKPWYKRFYDFPGVVGQLFGMRWFNISWLNYCSERVARKVRVILPSLRRYPTPEDIEIEFKRSRRMKILGYWFKP